MMLWTKLIAAIAGLIRSFVDYVEARRNEELGRLKEREANAEADRIVRDAIDRADPNSVSDDEAFGVGGSDNDLPRTGTRRPVNRPD